MTALSDSKCAFFYRFEPLKASVTSRHKLSSKERGRFGKRRQEKKKKKREMASSSFWTKTVSTSSFASGAAGQELQAAPSPRFVLFIGIDPSSKSPWCPDVRRCAPAVRRACEAAGASLLEVDVGGRAEWKGTATPHAFRAAPLSLTGIPTLLAVDAEGKEIGRCGSELEATGSEAEAAEVAGAFVARFK